MKAIIVEDSRLAREGLTRMLTQFTEIELLGAADHPKQALPLIEEMKPELLFLDIHMPGEDGFELLAKLSYQPTIIFTTAYSEYAIRSFEFDTIDYLVKPISQERLAQAIKKLFNKSGENQETKGSIETNKARLEINSKIFVKDGEKCHLVSLDAIRYIESCKNYVQLFFDNQRAYVKKSLNTIEERLPTEYFFRANRQHIINLQAIKSIEESMQQGYLVTLNNGKVLEISRRNAIELKERLSF
ncbi:LytR/AlgR family response regulator transcription factor [Undibacterium sp. Di24W]|uniref:LytR/AlgR family response regulator transcription factor n=1 Tax=Undibacterium sp. Di24W TaxID=3413033 RepID=UPI003BF2FA0E